MPQYTFLSVKDKGALSSTIWVTDICKSDEKKESVFLQGKLLTAFGAPLYESDNYEDAFFYCVKAAEDGGDELLLSVYNSCGRIAVGCFSADCAARVKKASAELRRYLKGLSPADFEQICVQLNLEMRVKFGIKEGEVFFENEKISADEAESYNQKWYGGI